MNLSSSSQLQAASRALRDARATGQPISSVPKRFEFEGLEATYAVVEISTAAGLEEPGRRIVGKKVGLKSEAPLTPTCRCSPVTSCRPDRRTARRPLPAGTFDPLTKTATEACALAAL